MTAKEQSHPLFRPAKTTAFLIYRMHARNFPAGYAPFEFDLQFQAVKKTAEGHKITIQCSSIKIRHLLPPDPYGISFNIDTDNQLNIAYVPQETYGPETFRKTIPLKIYHSAQKRNWKSSGAQ